MKTEKEIVEQLEKKRRKIEKTYGAIHYNVGYEFLNGYITALEWVLSEGG